MIPRWFLDAINGNYHLPFAV